MKILLAPAETKLSGGNGAVFNKNNFVFPELFEKRQEIVDIYEHLILNSTIEPLSNWFGLKKESEVIKYQTSVKNAPTMKAIQRYTGVAFDYLGYNDLDQNAQNYCDENVILFSNLFGPILAKDLIPDYKYKQGAKLPNMVVEKFYKEHFSDALDEYLQDDIIDLRAGFYDKFYIPKGKFVTMKFIKDGKVVSHWAKAYRGLILKHMAMNTITSIDQLMKMPMDGLVISEIKEIKNKKEFIYNIVE